MANCLMVSFGLSGPVTQPTSDVPGGAEAVPVVLLREQEQADVRLRGRVGRRGRGRDPGLLFHLRGAW